MNELSISTIWMLIIGEGTLCLMDGADAAIRSGGNI